MGLAIAGIIANLIATLATLANLADDGRDSGLVVIFAVILGGFVALSVLGLILAGSGKKKVGGILVIIGSVVFVPLGLIGAFGGRKIMRSDASANDLDARRELAAASASSPANASQGE